MKSFVIVLMFLGITALLNAQDKKGKENGIMKSEELPEIVIKSAGKDFSIYLTDKNPDPKVRRLEQEFVSYDLGSDYKGNDSYLVTMKIKNGVLAATYNENGKLISVVENYKNVKLPTAVIYSIYRAFPEWKIVNDKFLYAQEDGDIIKKQYKLKIRKNKEVKNLVVRPNGDIVKGN